MLGLGHERPRGDGEARVTNLRGHVTSTATGHNLTINFALVTSHIALTPLRTEDNCF